MKQVTLVLYGLLAYAVFLFTIVYAIGFVGNFHLAGFSLPKTIDTGPSGSVWVAGAIDAGLLGLFAVQHTVMARRWFKAWWTRTIPPAAERSTYVLVSSVILLVTFWLWRPITAVVWDIEHPVVRAVLIGVSLLGWGVVFYSTFLINHLDLFGLRQVMLSARGRAYSACPFQVKSLYRVVRHPLMVGFMIAFWSTPTMTAGHTLFAVATTLYILVGTTIEERDLMRVLGEDYLRYRERTPRLAPFIKWRRGARRC